MGIPRTHERDRRAALIVAALAVSVILGGCARAAYAGSGTPRAALDTFFSSAVRHDYAATYECYDEGYRRRISRSEFLQHRSQAGSVTGYRIDTVAESGTVADATATLTYAGSGSGANSARTVTVHERLVDEAGAWKVHVW